MSSRFPLIAIAVAAALPTVASAVDFSYSGFSTAAYSQTDTDLADVGYSSQPDSIDKGGSFEIDSKLGLQLTAKFDEMFSATVQGVAYTDLTGDWEPHLDWAYVRAQATQSTSFRAGYLRAPTFMYSDSVFVGYANTWVRPPMEVYNLHPVYQLLGVDATYRAQFGNAIVTVNPYYGEGEVELGTGKLEVTDWMGLATSVNYGSFQARIGYSRSTIDKSTLAIGALTDSLRNIPTFMCEGCAGVADQLELEGAKIDNFNVGVQYDDGANFLASEYGEARSDQGGFLLPDRRAAYVTYGHRFGNLMPYATVAGLRRQEALSTNAIPAGGALGALSTTVNDLIQSAGANDQDSYSLGVRYEVPSFAMVKGAVVKVQYDHIDADGRGNLNNVMPGFDGKVNMFSASFDFIF